MHCFVLLFPIIALLAIFGGSVMVTAAGADRKFMGEAKLMYRKDVEKLHRPSSLTEHTIMIGIKQRNLDELSSILYDISNPSSVNYGRYWTKQQVRDFTSNPIALQDVTQYLQEQNIDIIDKTIDHDYLIAKAPVATWERVLDCIFYKYEITSIKPSSQPDDDEQPYSYRTRKDSSVIIRAESYSLPKELSEHVFGMFNVVDFPFPSSPSKIFQQQDNKDKQKQQRDTSSKRSREVNEAIFKAKEKVTQKQEHNMNVNVATHLRTAVDTPSAPAQTIHFNDSLFLIEGYVTPQLLSAYYNISNTIVSNPKVSQGLLEAIDDAVSPQDLTLFQETFDLVVKPISQDINGHVTNQACNESLYQDCYESNLDVQYLMGVAQNVPTSYYYDPQTNALTWMPWVIYISNQSNPDTVYSISYATYELYIDEPVAIAWDTNAMKLGMIGTTIFVASGDDGAVGFFVRDAGTEYCGYFPMYPASSPYVTAVGGTQGPELNEPEIGCMSYTAYITSGGGFSNLYASPSYQHSAVAQYFQTVDNTSMQPYYNDTMVNLYGFYVAPGFYNRSGRGYPDIAVLAHNYIIAVDLNFTAVDGTSASTPVMAAMTNLVNNARKLKNLPTMGFMNPFLYQYGPSMFANDITVGDNHCSANPDLCCVEGFNVTTGWDPMTGLGSIDFQKFYDTAMSAAVSSSSSSSNALSAGAIAGITIGVIVGTGLLIGVGIFIYFRFIKSATLGGGEKAPMKSLLLGTL